MEEEETSKSRPNWGGMGEREKLCSAARIRMKR